MQVVNLLSVDYPPDLGARMCEEVLSTLVSLCKGNEASRQRLEADVGYDTLLSAVLGRCGEAGPTQGVLEQMLCLALEVSQGGAG